MPIVAFSILTGTCMALSYIQSIFTNMLKHNLIQKCLAGSLREGDGTPLRYSCLENPMDGGAWWAAVHGVMKSQTRLSHFTFTFHFHALEKEMATHSIVFAWRIPRDRGAWWGAVYGVAQSRTRPKRLSSSSSRESNIQNLFNK